MNRYTGRLQKEANEDEQSTDWIIAEVHLPNTAQVPF